MGRKSSGGSRSVWVRKGGYRETELPVQNAPERLRRDQARQLE
jgi:hypothetical protein